MIALDNFWEVAADETTMTKEITVGNHDNRILVVLVTAGTTSLPVANCASVIFNTTESLTYITGSNADNGDYQAVQGWYLIAPSVTTANVVLDWDGSTSPDGNMCIWSLYNVDQSTPVGAVNELGDTSGDSPILNSITTTVDDSWVLQVLGNGAGTVDPDRMVAASGQTKRNTGSGGSGSGDYDLFAGDLLVASHGATDINITDSINDGDWSQQLAVEIIAAAGAPAALVRDIIGGSGIIPVPR